jgi:septum formation protein
MREQLILASASAARAALLRAAAIEFAIVPAEIDEASIKKAARDAGKSALDAASALATAKACAVSRCYLEAFVIGGDQILALGANWFDKPRNMAEARAQLGILRGRRHTLATAVCVARRGALLWQAASGPELTMRRYSDDFLDAYLMAEGEAVLESVGAYRLEGRGAQLFERISGDYFAILGLPLLELLGFLRGRGIVPA